MKNLAFAATIAAVLSAGTVQAQNAPAVTFDVGGKFDRSFNQAAYDGAERFKKETGVQYAEFEVRNAAEREQSIRNLARRGGFGRRRGRLQQPLGGRDRRQGVPERQVHADRQRRRPAQRAVDRLPRARGLVPRRHGGSPRLEDRQGRLRRRHGHPADPQVLQGLRGRCEVRQGIDRSVHEHDRHDAGRVQRPDARRRTRARPVRPRRRRRLCGGGCHGPWRLPGRQGRAPPCRRRGQATRTTCIRARCSPR